MRYLCLILLLVCFTVSDESSSAAEKPPAKSKTRKLTFQDDILPIFRARCIRCHAGVEPKGGLNLAQPSGLLSGGESGAALRIGAAEFSLLYEKVASGAMPAVGAKLSAKEKGTIRTWINEGAEGVKRATTLEGPVDAESVNHWSFQPPRRPLVPEVKLTRRVRNPIDAFVLRKLESKQLTLAPEADRLTLLRRASFDLLGLPPTSAEVRRFLADNSINAYERMIDRLLASPRYGERWGRHWLDVAGYADSAGILNEDRPLPLMWRYRDYVIRAFNSDKPYDRFLQEQIAGDELTGYWTAYEKRDHLPGDVIEGITATGYLRTAADPSRPDFKTIKNAAALYHYPTLFDTLQIVCSSTLGLTIQCARCHSHKFDPIPQVDYYRMQAIFMSAYRPDAWIPQMNRRLKIASKKQLDDAVQRNRKIDDRVKEWNNQLAALSKEYAAKLFEARLAKLPAAAEIKAAFATVATARNPQQQKLVARYQKQLRPDGAELEKGLRQTFADYGKRQDVLKASIQKEQGQRPAFDEVRSLYDARGPVTTPVLLRGDPLTPGPPVTPGVISSIKTPRPFQWKPPNPLSPPAVGDWPLRWLTQRQHPLTARVIVNRVWMHHFGRGLVSTPEDFGVSGTPPSHPQLLDWLATEFVRRGWRFKSLHRLILTSSTWRQRSHVSESHKAAADGVRQGGMTIRPNLKMNGVDPENRLLSRQSLRRLEAEPLRDAFLSVSGLLDRSAFGHPAAVRRLPSGEVVVGDSTGRSRRSIYVQVLRLNPETMLEIFDQPEIAINCTRRSVSTVATQALTLLNSDVMVRAAESFADQVRQASGLIGGDDELVGEAVLSAFSRPATREERRLFGDFLRQQTGQYLAAAKGSKAPLSADTAQRKALADLCHILLSANEFSYVD